MSAHRTPDLVHQYATTAAGRGLQVIIAAAGGAAHLAGVVASHTVLPVIGIPVPTELQGGLDSLLSTVQMPGDVPVATVGVGGGGARNAGLLAVQILALADAGLAREARGLPARACREVPPKLPPCKPLPQARPACVQQPIEASGTTPADEDVWDWGKLFMQALFHVSAWHMSPEGATVNSHGREPLVRRPGYCRKPRRGDSNREIGDTAAPSGLIVCSG